MKNPGRTAYVTQERVELVGLMDSGNFVALMRALIDPSSVTNLKIEALIDPRQAKRSRLIEYERQTMLATALRGDPRFQLERWIPISHGSIGFSAETAAQQMLARAKSDGIESALHWLDKVLSTHEAKARIVKALHGVQCTEPVTLTDHIELVPYDSLPDSSHKRWLHPSAGAHNLFVMPLQYREPAAALLRAGDVSSFFLSEDADDKAAMMAWREELEDAVRVLGMVSAVIPLDAGNWTQYDDPDLHAAAEGQGMMHGATEFYPAWYDYSNPNVVTESMVGNRVRQFLALNTSDRDRLRIAMDRLIRSKQQYSVGNKAIDLAIAFEILLLKDENDELVQRISLRASRFLAGELERRRRNRAYVRALYKIRSEMVHTGRARNEHSVLKGSPKESINVIVECATRIFVEIADAILCRGAIPEWELVELVDGNWS